MTVHHSLSRHQFSEAAQTLYNPYSTEEDRARTNIHYELPPNFFLKMIGGAWHCYSCYAWPDGVETVTEAQETKLDYMARMMALKPGMRILDVGCGWGGPLVYLCQTYGTRGVGLTLSPQQKTFAEERVARHGVAVDIVLSHWREYTSAEPFDVVFTDEVMVHFGDLGGYFRKAYDLLHDEGRMINRELHFGHASYAQELSRGQLFLNDIYGATGNYRTLAEELTLLGEAGFALAALDSQALDPDYTRTGAAWLRNLRRHRDTLLPLVGREVYRNFYVYLKLVQHISRNGTMTLDTVIARKVLSR